MKTMKMRAIQREAKVNVTTITFDATTVDLDNATVVVAWLAFRARRNGTTRRRNLDFVDNNQQVGRWQNVQTHLAFRPGRVGYYSLIIVATIDNLPVTYRGVPIRVVA